MNNVWIAQGIRIILLILFQILVLKSIYFEEGFFRYMHIIIFPLGLYLLPISWSSILNMGIAFVTGLLLDMFYDSPGVHAATAVLIMYLRPFLLNLIRPVEGYKSEFISVKQLGLSWMVLFLGICHFTYCFVYFSIESFSFIYIFDIVMQSITSFICSFIGFLLYIIIIQTRAN